MDISTNCSQLITIDPTPPSVICSDSATFSDCNDDFKCIEMCLRVESSREGMRTNSKVWRPLHFFTNVCKASKVKLRTFAIRKISKLGHVRAMETMSCRKLEFSSIVSTKCKRSGPSGQIKYLRSQWTNN